MSQQTKELKVNTMLKSKVKELKVKNDEAKKMKNQIKKQDDHISSLVLDIRK